MDHEPRSIEGLLAHSSWVRTLARRLCSGAEADDLVQDAWVAALEHPPRDAGRARGWLGRVVVNLARARHRSAGARRAREVGTSRTDPAASASDLVARAELSRRLVEHVLSIDEPYRSTILSRYFDALSAEEIARIEGIPSSTVRTRLERGLALLRARLEREQGGSWLGALLPLAVGRRVGGGAALGEAGFGGVSGGFLAMSAPKIVALLAFAALGTWLVWPRSEPVAPGSVHERASTADVPRSVLPDSAENVTRSTVSPPPEAAPKTRAAPIITGSSGEPSAEEIAALEVEVQPLTIEGIVLRGRKPLEGGGLVFYWRGSAEHLPEHPRDARTEQAAAKAAIESTPIDARGLFRIAGLEAGEYTLTIDVGKGAQHETYVRLAADSTGRRIVIVLGSASVAGHVYGDRGVPVAGARVYVEGEFERRGSRSFRTQRATKADGSYAMTDLPAGSYWFGVRLDGAWTWPREDDLSSRIELAEGESRVLDFGTPEPAIVWTGTLRTRGGDAVLGPGRLHLSDRATKAYATVAFDERGTFRATVRPGVYAVQASLPKSYEERVALGDQTIGHADLERDLALPGVRVSGTVLDASTGAIWKGGLDLEIGLRPRDDDYPVYSAHADASGRFTFDGMKAGTWRVATHPLATVTEQVLTIQESDVEIAVSVAVKTR